jgi:integrative and conjugative element protein (TIGR02256 family)
MEVEADRISPQETGGVWMGYWGDNGDVVVTEIIGPGPTARHDADRFMPDHDFQEAEIARVYEDSGGMVTYLGDWHSHPDAAAYLSRKDRSTLRRIADDPASQISRPLMAVLSGGDPWELVVWEYWEPIIPGLCFTGGPRKCAIARYSERG